MKRAHLSLKSGNPRRGVSAFTLIELLVVVAIIALLISMLLPSLKQAREQGKRAKCLANMRGIGTSSSAYASEDSQEQIIPIHRSMVYANAGDGFFGQEWWWRTGMPYSFGGRTAQVPFPITGGSKVTAMMDDTSLWAARTRPLNKYIFGALEQSDSNKMDWFSCPSDAGYPLSAWIQDAPQEACDIPLYDLVGNSYRINVAGLVWLGGPGGAAGFFTVGAWGHRISSLEQPGRLILYSEPLFYNMSRYNSQWNPDLLPLLGWHQKLMTDNVVFVDGSARFTFCDKLATWDTATLQKMNYTTSYDWTWFLRRGRTWQTDCYPTPGTRICMRDSSGRIITPMTTGWTGWPFIPQFTLY